jgi:hypothetical protein
MNLSSGLPTAGLMSWLPTAAIAAGIALSILILGVAWRRMPRGLLDRLRLIIRDLWQSTRDLGERLTQVCIGVSSALGQFFRDLWRFASDFGNRASSALGQFLRMCLSGCQGLAGDAHTRWSRTSSRTKFAAVTVLIVIVVERLAWPYETLPQIVNVGRVFLLCLAFFHLILARWRNISPTTIKAIDYIYLTVGFGSVAVDGLGCCPR